MSSLLDIFKPAPHAQKITDEKEVETTYNYWRVRILYSMFFGYAFYYFSRKSFAIAMPGMIEDLGYEKSQLGLLMSVFAIVYGVSKFVSGILCDRSNPRYFMAAGLMMTGIVNILFGFCSNITMFAIFWGINGWFQGFGWPPCTRLLSYWYSHSERGSWWSTCSLSHNVGAFLIPWIASPFLQYYGWRYAMYVPGVLCILGALFLINRLRDNPESLGLPPIEEFRNDYGAETVKLDEKENLTPKEVLVKYVLKNRYMWLLAMAYFFVYSVRSGIDTWTSLYLIQVKGYSRIGANGCVSIFEIGGLFGSLTAGWASDKVFGAKRGPVNVLFAVCMLLSITLFWALPEGYPWMDSVSVFLIGFSIFGPQLLIGVAAAELSHKKAVSSANGFIGFFAYIGAAVAGYPLGKIMEGFGWEGFFFSLMACCVISLLFLVPMWNTTKRPETAPTTPNLTGDTQKV